MELRAVHWIRLSTKRRHLDFDPHAVPIGQPAELPQDRRAIAFTWLICPQAMKLHVHLPPWNELHDATIDEFKITTAGASGYGGEVLEKVVQSRWMHAGFTTNGVPER